MNDFKDVSWKVVVVDDAKLGRMISIQEDKGQVDDPDLSICGIHHVNKISASNANLIAAAPELLQALQMILEDDDSLLQCDALYKAINALDKALGKA